MPTFDFTCTACNTIFEKTLSFGVKTKPACPQCGSKKTEKMLSMPSVVFKGSGFYKNDSKSSPVPAKKTEKKEEAKPAAEKKVEPPAKPDTVTP